MRGAGGGSLTTPLLVSGSGIAPATTVGSELVHAVPLRLVAGTAHAFAGTVNHGLLTSLLIGALRAVIIGSMLGHRMRQRVVAVGSPSCCSQSG